jgi:Asp-tRNA(Asn)/Glu-tRNA(Gln) amidotransferase A subunit family amidase
MNVRRNSSAVFERVDVVATPTMPLVPPLLTELGDAEKLRPLELRMLRNTRPFNVLGWPTITLPSAALTDRLRLGLQISSPPGSDRNLLEVARKVENCIKELG